MFQLAARFHTLLDSRNRRKGQGGIALDFQVSQSRQVRVGFNSLRDLLDFEFLANLKDTFNERAPRLILIHMEDPCHVQFDTRSISIPASCFSTEYPRQRKVCNGFRDKLLCAALNTLPRTF